MPLHPHVRTDWLFSLIEYSGVVTGALGGALAARRDTKFNFDYIGVIGLGLISGMGGGITRDVIIQDGIPLALVNVRYLYLAMGGAVAGVLFGSSVGPRMQRTMLFIDALGLGFFAIAGATRAQSVGLTFLPCLLLGVMTAVGGGSLRDVFSGRTPRVFEHGEPYAIAAMLAVCIFLLLEHFGVRDGVCTTIGVLAGFALRIGGVHFQWRTRAIRVG